MSEISVVMTAYNREQYIGRAIESILSQTYKDFEFIIVDDGSTDNTPNIIDKYAKQDKRIKYIRQNNAGLARARNNGVSKSGGKYIAFMDDDDISMPERLEKQIEYLKNNPELDACVSPAERVSPQGTGLGFEQFISDRLPHQKDFLRNCYPVPFILGAYTLITKKAFDLCNGYRTNTKVIEDLDFTLRFQELFTAGVTAEILYKYTSPESNEGKNLSNHNPINSLKIYLSSYISAWQRRNGKGDPIERNESMEEIMQSIKKLPLHTRVSLYENSAGYLREARNFKQASNKDIMFVISVLRDLKHPQSTNSKINLIKAVYVKRLIAQGKWHRMLPIISY